MPGVRRRLAGRSAFASRRCTGSPLVTACSRWNWVRFGLHPEADVHRVRTVVCGQTHLRTVAGCLCWPAACHAMAGYSPTGQPRLYSESIQEKDRIKKEMLCGVWPRPEVDVGAVLLPSACNSGWKFANFRSTRVMRLRPQVNLTGKFPGRRAHIWRSSETEMTRNPTLSGSSRVHFGGVRAIFDCDRARRRDSPWPSLVLLVAPILRGPSSDHWAAAGPLLPGPPGRPASSVSRRRNDR